LRAPAAPADQQLVHLGGVGGLLQDPARWLITSALPLTATGKIRKNVLSAQLAEANTSVSTPRRGTTRRVG